MSVPISDRMTCALSVLMPGIEVRSSTPVRKGARLASTSRSISVIAASRALICWRWRLSIKRWWRLILPDSASRSLFCELLILVSARAASLAGSLSPAISASMIVSTAFAHDVRNHQNRA